MLKPELARQQLEKLKSKKHVEGRYNRVRKLPKPLVAIAFGITGRLPDGKHPKAWDQRRKLKGYP